VLIPLGLDDARLSRIPWVSLSIAGACLAIYAVSGEHVWSEDFDLCLVPSRGFLQVGWITARFAHANWSHVLWNLFYFALCAPFLEDAWGHRAFLGFYLAAGVVASLPSFLALAGEPIHILGASGAICACIGAFTWRFGRRRVRLFWTWSLLALKPTFTVPAWAWGLSLVAGDALSFALFGYRSGVGYAAHVTGFFVGVAAAIVSSHLRWERRLLSSEGGWQRSAHLAQGEAALLAGRHDLASTSLQAALAERPGDASARLALARLALDAGRPDEAVPHLERLANATSVQLEQLRELVHAVGPSRLRPATALLLAERLEQVDHLLAIGLADVAAAAGGRLGARALVAGAEIAIRRRDFRAAQSRAARALAAPEISFELKSRACAVESAASDRFSIPLDPVPGTPRA
jgi:membrane associated rhomboid family serine protease